MNPECIETVRFPEPQRRRPRLRYAPRPNQHGHWAWIVGLFLVSIAVGTVLFVKAPALWLPFCSVVGLVVFLAGIFGAVKSAVQK